MILGAIYAGKLAVLSAQCCLKRLQRFNELPAAVIDDGDATSSSATKDDSDVRKRLMQRSGTSNAAGSLSSSRPVQAVVSGDSLFEQICGCRFEHCEFWL